MSDCPKCLWGAHGKCENPRGGKSTGWCRTAREEEMWIAPRGKETYVQLTVQGQNRQATGPFASPQEAEEYIPTWRVRRLEAALELARQQAKLDNEEILTPEEREQRKVLLRFMEEAPTPPVGARALPSDFRTAGIGPQPDLCVPARGVPLVR